MNLKQRSIENQSVLYDPSIAAVGALRKSLKGLSLGEEEDTVAAAIQALESALIRLRFNNG